MSDEIKLSKKEIIGICEFLKIHHFENAYILLDYIINLQQENEKLSDKVEFYEDVDSDRCAYNEELQKENERLKELCDEYEEEHSNEFKIWKEERHKLLDYKSRCEKADNQLKIIMQIIKEQPTRNIEDDEWLENRLIGVVNILQNGSDNKC